MTTQFDNNGDNNCFLTFDLFLMFLGVNAVILSVFINSKRSYSSSSLQ